jgi:hypothetical protein
LAGTVAYFGTMFENVDEFQFLTKPERIKELKDKRIDAVCRVGSKDFGEKI